MKTVKELKVFLEDLYVNVYHLPKPRITKVKDGVYIHSGNKFYATLREAKLFVNIYDFNQSIPLMIQYLENADDSIIHKIEEDKEK